MPARKSSEVKSLPETTQDTQIGGRDLAQEDREIKRILSEQPKRTIKLYQVPENSTDNPLPDEFVSINGYPFVIKRGVNVDVPETVAEVLEQAGRL